jgi:N-acyl-D-aspartate/D-glutamate deacylase
MRGGFRGLDRLACPPRKRGSSGGLVPLAPNKGSRRRVQPRGLVFTAVQGVISRDTCRLAGSRRPAAGRYVAMRCDVPL